MHNTIGMFQSFEQGVSKEWLLTNGIGGFASSTAVGANTRRYHGLLVASLNPPVNRILAVSKLNESVTIGNQTTPLHTDQFSDAVCEGFRHLHRFVAQPVPTYTYFVNGVWIVKKVCMVFGQNITTVQYQITTDRLGCQLDITPLVNHRDFHSDIRREHLHFEQQNKKDGVILQASHLSQPIYLNISKGTFEPFVDYFYNMVYQIEAERGLCSVEDHYMPGKFTLHVPPAQCVTVTVTMGVGATTKLDAQEVISQEILRQEKLITQAKVQNQLQATTPLFEQLTVAADQFIVFRQSTKAKTVLAGYPWFNDWGRDTMIALTGLTMVTGRLDDAKDILTTFSHYIEKGLVPNCFPDQGETPCYNTVDASLWYVDAVHRFIKYGGDEQYAIKHFYPCVEQIIHAYMNGTSHDIFMEEDGLIHAGNAHTQLTWMDAMVNNVVFTPRYGKAVEINALWFNALNIYAKLFPENKKVMPLIKKVQASFIEIFWHEDHHCLYDTAFEGYKDGTIRPNQIFAVSLDFPVLTGDKAKQVVSLVYEQLYTPYGLRSLSPYDVHYHSNYYGDHFNRDAAYHQGTAWSWLSGHFITAYLRVHGYDE
ncbi:MAG: glycogen debranching enzyme N-terminal domain-containing protein, partial [Hyphomonadaceae bacterium]|nr:glycogen debranching enzyme N-terminal domain-containing protein [Clostridia bacterium]